MIQAVKEAEKKAQEMEKAAYKKKDQILSDARQEIEELKKQTELMQKKEREEALSLAKKKCDEFLMEAKWKAEQESNQLRMVAESKKELVFQLVLEELKKEA